MSRVFLTTTAALAASCLMAELNGCASSARRVDLKRSISARKSDNLQVHVFVFVPAGQYWVGSAGHPRNPRRQVHVDSFEIADAETTNAQFSGFVDATGYTTDAERRGEGQIFVEGMADWEWRVTSGACWRFPFGPDQPGATEKPDHPVTQISAADAEAYCQWAGVRLPTLAEWEVAARAGASTRYPWGDEFPSLGRMPANIWNGATHAQNTLQDGYLYTSQVRSFPPNAWGLYEVIGNVFEYCADPGIGRDGRPDERLRTGRGGSWWCSANTCSFYNLVDIGQMNRRGSLCNQGFRVAR